MAKIFCTIYTRHIRTTCGGIVVCSRKTHYHIIDYAAKVRRDHYYFAAAGPHSQPRKPGCGAKGPLRVRVCKDARLLPPRRHYAIFLFLAPLSITMNGGCRCFSGYHASLSAYFPPENTSQPEREERPAMPMPPVDLHKACRRQPPPSPFRRLVSPMVYRLNTLGGTHRRDRSTAGSGRP